MTRPLGRTYCTFPERKPYQSRFRLPIVHVCMTALDMKGRYVLISLRCSIFSKRPHPARPANKETATHPGGRACGCQKNHTHIMGLYPRSLELRWHHHGPVKASIREVVWGTSPNGFRNADTLCFIRAGGRCQTWATANRQLLLTSCFQQEVIGWVREVCIDPHFAVGPFWVHHPGPFSTLIFPRFELKCPTYWN